MSALVQRSRGLAPGLQEPGRRKRQRSPVDKRVREVYAAFKPDRHAFEPHQETPYLSDRAHAATDVATDGSYAVRAANGLTHQGSTALDATQGFSTVLNLPLGLNAIDHAKKEAAYAHSVGYHEKARLAELSRVGGGIKVLTSGLYVGVRGASLASYITGTDTSSITAPTLLGRVSFVLSNLGSALWGVLYGLIVVRKALEMYEAWDFRRALEKADKEIPADPEQRYANISEFLERWNPDVRQLKSDMALLYTPEELCEEALVRVAALVNQKLKEGGLVQLQPKNSRKIAEDIIRADAKMHSVESEEHCKKLGVQWKVAQLQELHYLKVASMTNKVCADKLFGRSDQIMGPELISKMKTAMDKKFWINLGYFMLGLIGLAATIAAIVATGGVAAIVIGVAFLVVGLGMTGLDGYGLHESIASETTVGRADEKTLTISSVVSFLSFVAAIVLVSVFSLGIVPLISAIVIFVFWLGVNIKVGLALRASKGEIADDWVDVRKPDPLDELILPLIRARYFKDVNTDVFKKILSHRR